MDEYLRRLHRSACEAMVRHLTSDRQWYMAARNPLHTGWADAGVHLQVPLSVHCYLRLVNPYSQGSMGKLTEKWRETEGGEALTLILRHPSSAWTFSFFSTLTGNGGNLCPVMAAPGPYDRDGSNPVPAPHSREVM